jgi:hypothetical protein
MPVPGSTATPLRAAALAAALLLAGCGGGGGGGKSGGTVAMAFTPIAPGTFAVVIDPNANVPKTEAAFRKQCAGRQDCTILAWTKAGAAAHGIPLTDQQTAALALRYVHRAAGQDEMMWDCVSFPAAKAPCLSKA